MNPLVRTTILLLFIGAGLLKPGLAAGKEAFVPGQIQDYQKIKSLQDKLGIKGDLPVEGSSKPDMLLALAEVGARASAPASTGQFQANDYDALYSLLQKYRDELKALGVKMNSLEDMMVEIKKNQDEVERRSKALSKFNFDGLKIYGHFLGQFDDLDFTGPGSKYAASPAYAAPNGFGGYKAGPGSPAAVTYTAGIPFRYRNLKESVDLSFVGTRGPLSALVVFKNDAYFGGYDANVFFGITRMEMEARLPVLVQVADYYAKMTPLTLWSNQDVFDGEPEPFRERRDRHMSDLDIKSDSLSLRGVRLETDLVLLGRQVINMEGMIHGVGYPKTALYFLGGYPPDNNLLNPYTPNTVSNGVYNTFMGAWRIQTRWFDHLDTGYAGTEIKDATDTGVSNYGSNPPQPIAALSGKQVLGYDSQVHSLQAVVNFSLVGSKVRVGGEFAESLYSNPNRADFYDNSTTAWTGYLTGTAMVAKAEAGNDWYQALLAYRIVTNSFISAPAQNRTQDARYFNYGPFMHENIHYNPATGDFTNYYLYNHPANPAPGLESFNPYMLPPQMMASNNGYFFNYLIPYDASVNPGSPYGEATPNRQGVNLKVSLKLLNGGIKPWVKYESLSEIQGCYIQNRYGVGPNLTRAAESYSGDDFGAAFDLKSIMKVPVTFSGSFGQRGVKSPDWVSFNSTLYTFGAGYDFNEKAHFYGGLEHIDYTGTLAYPLHGGYGDPILGFLRNSDLTVLKVQAYQYTQAYDIWSLGLFYQLNDQCSLDLSYTTQYFWDDLSEKDGNHTHYQVDQGYIGLDMKF